MKMMKVPSLLCFDCGITLPGAIVPGRVAAEPQIWVVTHPGNGCVSEGESTRVSFSVYDTSCADAMGRYGANLS